MDTRCNYIINSYLQPVCVFSYKLADLLSVSHNTHTEGGAVISNEWIVWWGDVCVWILGLMVSHNINLAQDIKHPQDILSFFHVLCFTIYK